jgi:hypothetical protein
MNRALLQANSLAAKENKVSEVAGLRVFGCFNLAAELQTTVVHS